MYQHIVTKIANIDLVLVAEIMFFAIFLFCFAWAYRKGSKSYYEKLGANLLDLDPEVNNGK